jgi:hemerythrin-like domain-containing protein
MLIPHEPLRQLLLDMEHATAVCDASSEWQATNIFKFYADVYVPYLHHHHDLEEQLFFPSLVARGAVVPPKTTADHQQLLLRMNDALAVAQAGRSTGDQSSRVEALRSFGTKLAALRTDMFPHLAEEEELVPRLLRELKMTEQEFDAIIERIMKTFSLKNVSIALPMIVRYIRAWGGEEKTAKFIRGLPGPLRGQLGSWTAEYNRSHYGLLTDVMEGKYEATPPARCFCCLCYWF